MQDLCSHTQNYVFLLHASSYPVALCAKVFTSFECHWFKCVPKFHERNEWFFSCIYNMNITKPLVVIFYAFVWMIYRIPTMVLHTIKVPLNIHVNMIVRCIIAFYICDVACMTMILHESYISITFYPYEVLSSLFYLQVMAACSYGGKKRRKKNPKYLDLSQL